MFSASAMPAINWLRTKTGTNIPAIMSSNTTSERVRQFPDQPNVKAKPGKKTLRDTEPAFLLNQNLPHLLDRETGILNRSAIEWKLNYEVLRAKRYRRPVSILLLSIDNLENTSERYGALAGAELVTYLGSLLKEHTRDTDFVGRIETNLFVIICPETPQLNALKIVRRVGRQMQARAMSWSNRPINTISVGSACSPSDGETVSLLLQKAMQHLDMAKRDDGDCVFFTA
ncbi:MAG: GGDEF domain-containing protein [Leptolyngbya sp.]|nr:GGDEF domain-containing protein [Candidatus Melainabacteria bacterium]